VVEPAQGGEVGAAGGGVMGAASIRLANLCWAITVYFSAKRGHMADGWYYARGDQKVGPLTIEQLKTLANSGHLRRTDDVWCEGMKQWTPASEVKHLFSASSSTVPAVVTPPVTELIPDNPLEESKGLSGLKPLNAAEYVFFTVVILLCVLALVSCLAVPAIIHGLFRPGNAW
jgi:hypothetical protein